MSAALLELAPFVVGALIALLGVRIGARLARSAR